MGVFIIAGAVMLLAALMIALRVRVELPKPAGGELSGHSRLAL